MNDISNNLRDLYYKFGRAAEMAQVMEIEAGNLALAYVSFVFDLDNISDENRRMFKAIIDDVDKRTFGYLLKNIRKTGEISDDIEKTMDNALEKRNYLIHKFFKTHNYAINSDAGRREMIEELDQIYNELSRAHTVLSLMTDTFSEIWGLPKVTEEEVLVKLTKGERIEI